MAPVVAELASRDGFRPIVAVTAQHREMLDQVLRLFSIEPDADLDIMKPGQTLTDITVRSLSGLTPLIERAAPRLVARWQKIADTFTSVPIIGEMTPARWAAFAGFLAFMAWYDDWKGGGFFAAHCHCHPDGRNDWTLEESRTANNKSLL